MLCAAFVLGLTRPLLTDNKAGTVNAGTPIGVVPAPTKQVHLHSSAGGDCSALHDGNTKCSEWSSGGECSNNPDYMMAYCKRACCEAGAGVAAPSAGGSSASGGSSGGSAGSVAASGGSTASAGASGGSSGSAGSYSGTSSGDSVSCECGRQSGETLLFYNRVPKCGSTTMLNYISNASQREDPTTHKKPLFKFIRSDDYDMNHFHPDTPRRTEILTNMVKQAGGKKTVFERHMYYLKTADLSSQLGGAQLEYINLLRDPGSLRASGFYFYRNCVCNQRSSFTDENGNGQEQDEWCRDDWSRKSDAFCKTTVNDCYQNPGECFKTFNPARLGGTTLTNFLCGTDEACLKDKASDEKVANAKANILQNYRLVMILENMEDSLNALQTIYPDLFGGMDAKWWSEQHNMPDGGSLEEEHTAHEDPITDETVQTLLAQPETRAEYEVYDFAKKVLQCKLKACGISSAAGPAFWKLRSSVALSAPTSPGNVSR